MPRLRRPARAGLVARLALVLAGVGSALLIGPGAQSFAAERPAAARSPAAPTGWGTSSQMITVRTATAGATTGTLTAWEKSAAGVWRVAFGPMTAQVGHAGIGQAAEGSSLTPAGTYRLDQAFGRKSNPGTAVPYFSTDEQDWWDANPVSATYNTHVRQPDSPGGASENLYESGTVYDYAVNIAYNAGGVPGAGSAFFLHVSQGVPTAGCVAIDEAALVSILRWLDPARTPVISIAVGPAWAPGPAPVTGRLESVVADRTGVMTVSGWAADPVSPASSMSVEVMVTGPSGAAVRTATRTARSRADISRAMPWVGPNSGYLVQVAAQGVGINRVCAAASTASGAALGSSSPCLYLVILPSTRR